MAAIDYGVMAFCNGKQIYAEDLYPEIKAGEYAIFCYKYSCEIFCDEEPVASYYCAESEDKYSGSSKKSARFSVSGCNFHIKEICPGVYRLKFSEDGNHYTVLYGYGIDNSAATWNRIKIKYLGEERAKIVDREIVKALS